LVSKQIGAIFAILGGIFYILGSLVGTTILAGFLFGVARASQSGTVTFLFLMLGLVAGLSIIAGGSYLISDKANRRRGGAILVTVMMIIGLVPTLGGLGIGFFLTLIGSILGLTYNEGSPDIVIGVANTGQEPVSRRTRMEPDKLKFCIKCGVALPEGAVFCGVCGAPIPQQSIPTL
jgi:hypothetical protein